MGKRKRKHEMTYAHNGVYQDEGKNSQEAFQAEWRAQMEAFLAQNQKEVTNGEPDRTRTPECLE